jgi:flagellar motor protein MotB
MLLILLFSCVTKGTHEVVEVQLDATRTALSAKNAYCYEEVRDREERLLAQDDALGALQDKHDSLSERHEQQRIELERTRAELASEIAPETAERVQTALAVLADRELVFASELEHFATWKARLVSLEEQGRLTVVQKGPDVVVRIPTVQVFNEGRVSVSPRGEVLLVALSEAMADISRDRLQITAHTDNRPYHSASYASSWELGFAQAMTVVRTLQSEEGGDQIIASSAAGTMPLAAGDDDASRKLNRRLEIVIRP